MSIISKIPDNSRVRYPLAVFGSDILDANSDYNFGIAANANVLLMDSLNAGNVYLIERVSFFANVADSDWLEGMKLGPDLPRVSLSFLLNANGAMFGDPFRMVNYVDNNEALIYCMPTKKNESLVATMVGKVGQVAGMVGKATLRAECNFTVYEITDSKWIQLFQRDPARLGLTLRV